jgi:uncharacterized protein
MSPFMTKWLPPVGIGLAAGLLSGSFGVGGGVIIVPALVLLLHFRQRLAHGTSLMAILPIAVAGVLGFAVHGSINLPFALFLGFGSIAGALIGTRILNSISNVWLSRAFSVLLLITAIRLFIEVPTDPRELEVTPATAIILVAIGVLIGALSGLLGVGGGIFLVPILVLFFGAASPIAKGTSLLVAIIAGSTSTWRNYRKGNLDIPIAMRIGIAGIPTAFLGAQLAMVMSARLSLILFAGLLVFSAVQLLRSRPAE